MNCQTVLMLGPVLNVPEVFILIHANIHLDEPQEAALPCTENHTDNLLSEQIAERKCHLPI